MQLWYRELALRPIFAYIEGEPMKATTLAERIKTRRAALGLSVDDLADAVGVSAMAVRKWESGGTTNLKHEHLFDVAEALNVSVRWLALGDCAMDGAPNRDAYSTALTRREKAPSERERRAWERIALVFAKAAAIAVLVLLPFLHTVNDAQAAPRAPDRCVLCQIALRGWATLMRFLNSLHSEPRTVG